jgi:hypothetical protein
MQFFGTHPFGENDASDRRDSCDYVELIPSSCGASVIRPEIPFVPAWHWRPRNLVNTWECYSSKAGRDVRLRGDLNYFLFLAIESTPSITAFCEHPSPIDAHAPKIPKYSMWCRATNGAEYLF